MVAIRYAPPVWLLIGGTTLAKMLRDRQTGELYGWNAAMSKLPNLEEFDPEDPAQAWTGPADISESNGPRDLPPTVVSDDPDAVVSAALARAAAQGKADANKLDVRTASIEQLNALTEDQLAELSQEEIAVIYERLESEPDVPIPGAASTSPEPAPSAAPEVVAAPKKKK